MKRLDLGLDPDPDLWLLFLFFKYLFFSVSVEGPEAASGVDGQLSYFSGTEKKTIYALDFFLKKTKYRFPCIFFEPTLTIERKAMNKPTLLDKAPVFCFVDFCLKILPLPVSPE